MPQSHQNSKNHKRDFKPIDESIERIAKLFVDAAYAVHVKLGPGLLKKVYEVCYLKS